MILWLFLLWVLVCFLFSCFPWLKMWGKSLCGWKNLILLKVSGEWVILFSCSGNAEKFRIQLVICLWLMSIWLYQLWNFFFFVSPGNLLTNWKNYQSSTVVFYFYVLMILLFVSGCWKKQTQLSHRDGPLLSVFCFQLPF